jgi:hypothetical protein
MMLSGCGILETETEPLVNTLNASRITYNQATLNGNLAYLGKASKVQVSFEWGKREGPYSLFETTAKEMTSIGDFSSDIKGLKPATTYYFRTKAVGDGTRYGPEWSFKTSEVPAEELTILSHEMSATDFGIKVVKGQAKNTGTKNLSYAEVEVGFKDTHGMVLETSIDTVTDLNAGDTWNFEVMYLGRDDSNVTSYEITVGTLISSDDNSGTTGDSAAVNRTPLSSSL